MTELSILITGRAASGKSSLVNALLGLRVQDEGAAIENESPIQQEGLMEIKEYRTTKDNVNAVVWDTPGLRDGTQNEPIYIEQMKRRCSGKIDLMIYCINSSVTRFTGGKDNDEMPVMRMLTQAFGTGIWKKTIIALTFANNIEATHMDWRTLSPEEKTVKFCEQIQKLKRKIYTLLTNEVRIEATLASSVKIIPAGYHTEKSLPDREFWFAELWFECLGTMAPEAQKAFYLLNKDRIKNREELGKGDFQMDMEGHPIVIGDETKKETIAKLAKYSIVGVVAGGVIGGVASGVGVIPITVGAAAGAVVAGCVGFFVNYSSKKDTK